MAHKRISRPACFDSAKQWEAWCQYNGYSGQPVSPCHDCTPDYQHRTLNARRCEQPAVVFVRFHGETVGVMPTEVGYYQREK